ncbi:MAG: glycosyltransferase family 4 protein [Verrucomicrobiales bacterium]
MKVLIARSGYSPSGGAEQYLRRLGRGLLESGFDPVLLAHPEWPEEAWPGRIERIPKNGPVGFARSVETRRESYPGVPLFSMTRVPAADLYRAGDGVHACWLQRLADEETPLASSFRRTRRMHRQILALERRMFSKNSDLLVIANSRMVARELTTTYDFPSERITVIPNGFRADPVSPEKRLHTRRQVRAELGIPENARVIVFVGTGWKRKGADLLSEAFRNLSDSDTHLIFVGKGHLEAPVPPRVHLTGPVPDPKPYLFAADLFALPTLYDPFSNACLEAAAFGLPVLTTDANGFHEALQAFPGAGETVPIPRSASAWTEALERWLELQRVQSARAPLQNLARAYSFEKNLTATLEQLTRLVPQRS